MNKINNFSIPIKLKERGVSSFKRFCIKSIYPFGIIRTKIYVHLKSVIYVYPKAIKPPENLLNDFNISNYKSLHHDFDGIEEFRRGDSLSKIAWKKSTINQKKNVKKFKDPKRPKRPKSAYLYFCNDYRQQIKDELINSSENNKNKNIIGASHSFFLNLRNLINSNNVLNIKTSS